MTRPAFHRFLDALLQDLERTELDCAQLCFAELGRLAPGAAIERIPATFVWPEPYRREVLRRFLTSLGSRQAVSQRYQAHWERCFAEIIGKVQQDPSFDEDSFARILHGAGVFYDRAGTLVHLRAESGISGLEMDAARSMDAPEPIQDSDLIEVAYARVRSASDPAAAAVARKRLRALQYVEAREMRRRGEESSFLSQKMWNDFQHSFEEALVH